VYIVSWNLHPGHWLNLGSQSACPLLGTVTMNVMFAKWKHRKQGGSVANSPSVWSVAEKDSDHPRLSDPHLHLWGSRGRRAGQVRTWAVRVPLRRSFRPSPASHSTPSPMPSSRRPTPSSDPLPVARRPWKESEWLRHQNRAVYLFLSLNPSLDSQLLTVNGRAEGLNFLVV
jgi:hypothetical protein